MRWDTRFRAQIILLGVALVLAAPLIASLLHAEFLRRWIVGFGHLMEHHRFRELTGYAALSLILCEVSLSLRKRTGLPFPGSFPLWRSVHMLIGVALVLVIVIHTGGRWGVNLNGWLLSSLILTTFTALAGKAVEARLVERLTEQSRREPIPIRRLAGMATEPLRRTAAFAATAFFRVAAWKPAAVIQVAGASWRRPNEPLTPRRPRGMPIARLRAAWLHTHILLVAALVVLLGFHILSVYYF